MPLSPTFVRNVSTRLSFPTTSQLLGPSVSQGAHMRRQLVLALLIAQLAVACAGGPAITPTATPQPAMPLPRPLERATSSTVTSLTPSPVSPSSTVTTLRPLPVSPSSAPLVEVRLG